MGLQKIFVKGIKMSMTKQGPDDPSSNSSNTAQQKIPRTDDNCNMIDNKIREKA